MCGLVAVKALFARDPGAIKRLYFDYPTGRRIGVICQTLAAARKIYRCVEPIELEKVAGTVHHGGIVAVIEPRVLRAPRREDVRAWAQARAPLLLLDRIANAHNLGAIVRTAAFFGVGQIVDGSTLPERRGHEPVAHPQVARMPHGLEPGLDAAIPIRVRRHIKWWVVTELDHEPHPPGFGGSDEVC